MTAHAVVGTEVDMVFFLADVMLTCGSELASTQTVELPGSGAGVGFVWALVRCLLAGASVVGVPRSSVEAQGLLAAPSVGLHVLESERGAYLIGAASGVSTRGASAGHAERW